MYPLLCPAGYGIPVRTGKLEIVKVTAACSDSTAAARLQLVDSARGLPASKNKEDRILVDLKRVAVCDANIVFDCPEPIKVRSTVSPLLTTNLVPGSVMVYVR
jgi:hypothetical protein